MEKVKEENTGSIGKGDEIIDKYVQHLLENGTPPISIYKFAKEMDMREEEFYEYFSSFESIQSAVWTRIFEKTKIALESQEVFKEYSSREKFLGLCFTWIEELKKYRSYFLLVHGKNQIPKVPVPAELKEFKANFKEYVNDIILEGKETEEIANRAYISDKYDEALWLQTLFLFQFWIKDNSKAFEKTDAAIEKSVNLAFDLMGKSAFDSFVDLAKFLYQSK